MPQAASTNLSDGRETLGLVVTVTATFIDGLAAWATLATALGTGLLAFATFSLAKKTTREVEAATAQAEASGRQVEESARQAKAAEQAVLAQTSPLLADVPWGLLRRPSGSTAVGSEDAATVRVTVPDSRDAAALLVPFRNVGNGTAIIQTTQFILSGNSGFAGSTSTPVVPPGEVAEARFRIDPGAPGSQWLGEVMAMYDHYRSFSVVLGYGDSDGVPRGAFRLDVQGRDEREDWYVRQVFFARTIEEARTKPTTGSQPID